MKVTVELMLNNHFPPSDTLHCWQIHTSEKRLSSFSPSISHLRLTGCSCWPLLPVQLQSSVKF